jgi:biopolymer transport protein TolR
MNVSVGKAAVRSEINVTPLVDVCLVLLIIFMVITPMLQRENKVFLPEMGKPGQAPEQGRQLAVAMREDGTVLVDATPVAQSDLTDFLRRLREANPDRPVIVQGDRRLRYDQISRLIESIEDAGFQRVGLVTERHGN